MQKIIPGILLLMISFSAYTQSPTINLQKYFGGSGNDYGQFIEKTNDGNLIIIGTILSADGNITGYHGGNDIWVAKISPLGTLIWQRAIGGSKNDIPVGFNYDNVSGTLTVLGNTESTDGDVISSRGQMDVFVCQLNSTGTLIWEKSFGGTLDEKALNLISTSDGNLLFTAITASSNLDVTANHGKTDLWLVKINNTGTILWQKCYGGTDSEFEQDFGTSLLESTPGVIYFSVNTASTNGDITGFNGGQSDAWIVKTDATGNIAWQKCIGGTGNDYIRKVRVTLNGSVASLIQTASGNMPGYHVGTGGYPNNFDVLKTHLSVTGNILTQQCYGSKLNEVPVDLLILNDSIDVMLVKVEGNGGNITGTHVGDEFSKDLWMAKTKRDTILLWQKALGGSKDEQPAEWLGAAIKGVVAGQEMKALPGGDILYSCLSRSNDGDVKRVSAYGSFFDYNIWLFAIDSVGTIQAQQNIGGGSNEWQGISTIASTGNSYYTIGTSESYNNAVPAIGKTGDILVLKFSGDDYVTGKVYYDKNSNDTMDINETLVNNAVISTQKPGAFQHTFSQNGLYRQALDTGIYQVACKSPSVYFTASPVSVADTFKLYFRTDTIDFALKPVPGKRDAGIVVTQLNELRLDSSAKYQLNYFNQGTDTIPAGIVVFKKDPRMTVVSSNPAISATSADSLKWNFTGLKPFESRIINLVLKAPNTPSLLVNDTLRQLANILPLAGDLTPIDNADSIYQIVWGIDTAFQKSENHSGYFQQSYISSGGYLNYTIRYRNTTASTLTDVSISDTLDISTDSLSFQMIAASHAYDLSVIDGKKMTWTFKNIQLPPNSSSPALSSCFISFRVKLKTSVTSGTTIKNTAYLTADTLPKVVSNEVDTKTNN